MGKLSPAELAEAGAPVLYTPQQAAEIMGGGESKVLTAYWFKAKARTEEIPCTRIGRAIMFSPEDLAEIARAGRQRPKPAPLPPRTAARRRTAVADGLALKAKPPQRKRDAA